MTVCSCAAHSMLPATGALIEGEGPRDGCSRAARDLFGMLRVWESVGRLASDSRSRLVLTLWAKKKEES